MNVMNLPGLLMAWGQGGAYSCVELLLALLELREGWYWILVGGLGLWGLSLRVAQLLPSERAWQLTILRLGGSLLSWLIPMVALALAVVIAIGYLSVVHWVGQEGVAAWIKHIGWLHRGDLVAGVWCGTLLAALAWYWVASSLEPDLSTWLFQRARSATTDSLTDARTVASSLPALSEYDAAKKWKAAARQDRIFLGLNDAGLDETISYKSLCAKNIQVVGPPGSGKGVFSTSLIAQCIELGSAALVIEPKHDEWAAPVLREVSRRLGRPFHVVDLTAAVAQINPLRGIAALELAELLQAGFGLESTGEASDFYRLDDRKACRHVAAIADQGAVCLASLYEKARQALPDELQEGAKGFLTRLEEVASVIACQTIEGVDLAAIIRDGGCVLIRGSTRSEPVVVLQKMLLLRAIQIVERRERQAARHLIIFADELKYLLSNQVLNALGTVRDKKCSLILAHQSLGDLGNCGPNLRADDVKAVVLDNTPIKCVYRAADEASARWAAGLTGTILVASDRRLVTRNEALSEIAGSERAVQQIERHHFDINTIQHLPDGCAVCIAPGEPARLLFSRPLKVSPEKTPLVTASRYEPKSVADALLPTEKELPL